MRTMITVVVSVAAAVHTTLGGILLSLLACCVGQLSFWFLQPEMFDSFNGTELSYYFGEAWTSWLLCPLLGILGLWGIPFFIIQITCFYEIVWAEKSILHRFFIIAYSQLALAFLTQCFLIGWNWDDTIALGLALLVIGLFHGSGFWTVGLQRQSGRGYCLE